MNRRSDFMDFQVVKVLYPTLDSYLLSKKYGACDEEQH